MKKLLIIEDNEQNLYMMRYLLERKGYRIISAENGPDGIELAKSETPDGILLDIQLPEMDGYEVASRLKKIPCICSIPIIAVTSYAMPGDRKQALRAGADGYIEKPVDPDTFAETIGQFLVSYRTSGGEDYHEYPDS